MSKRLPWLLGISFIGALALAGSALAAEATPGNALLATSKGNHTLAIIDPSSDKIIAKMPIGPDPHEVIASEDGRTAYVTNMGGSSGLHRIDVLDLIGQRALEPIDTGALTGLHGLAGDRQMDVKNHGGPLQSLISSVKVACTGSPSPPASYGSPPRAPWPLRVWIRPPGRSTGSWGPARAGRT